MQTRELPPSSDPVEQKLREEWHNAKAEAENGTREDARIFREAHQRLADYLWNRALKDIEAERRRFPKRKANLPKGTGGPSGGRALP